MTTTAPAIVRRAKTDRIGTMLKQQKANPRLIRYGSEFTEPPLPMPEPTPIPGVGQFDTPGYLPTGPGTPDPIVTSTSGPSSSPDYWTRIDPNMGYIDPTLTVYPSNPADAPGSYSGNDPSGSNVGTAPGSLSATGPFPGGNMGGPQGSIYAYNPVTGNPIYNVTGSPRPGFFDTPFGKFTKGVGSTALNAFVPGAGFVAGKILDAARRANERRNTGTDLSGRNRPGSIRPGGGMAPSGPPPSNTFNRGPGIGGTQGFQQMTPREYGQATFGGLTPIGYRDTAGSATFDPRAANLAVMASQAFGGNPNRTGTFAKEGRFLLDAEGTPTQFGDQSPGNVSQQFRRPQGGPTPYASNQAAVNDWLRAQPAYRQFMQGRGG